MISMDVSICIEAPAPTVWRWLADLEAIEIWSDAVLRARCDGDVKRGVGAERVCDLRGGIVLRETWSEWLEGVSFKYEGRGLPFVERATNHWTLVPQGNKTLLTSHAEVELKGGWFGVLFEPVFRLMAQRTADNAFLPFKFLVENGRPAVRGEDDLGSALPAC